MTMPGEQYIFELTVAPRTLGESDIDRLTFLKTLLGGWSVAQRLQVVPDYTGEERDGSFVVSFGFEGVVDTDPQTLVSYGLRDFNYTAQTLRGADYKPTITKLRAWPAKLLTLSIDYAELEERKTDLTDVMLANELG